MSIVKKVDGKNITFADKPIIDHNQLIGRENYGAHPISAIRKLPEKLTEIKKKIVELEDKSGVTQEYVDTKDIDTLTTATDYTDNHIENVNDKITTVETKAKGINLAENQGELTFTNYNGKQTSFRSGYEVDNDTIQLKNDKISLKKIYADNTLEGIGTEENPLLVNIDNTTIIKTAEGKLHATALSTTAGTLTGDQINSEFIELNNDITQLNADISSQNTKNKEQDDKIYNLETKTSGMGGYLNANNFGDLSNKPEEIQTLLTSYAKQEIGVTEQSLIFNGTKVINSFDKHLWILTNTPTSDPAVFDWSDQGETKEIAAATNDLFGLVKGSLEDLQGSVDATGHITINGLNEALLQKADLNENNSFNAVNTFKADTILDGTTNFNNAIYLTNVADNVKDSVSKIYFGNKTNPYAFISANIAGAFGIFNTAGNGIVCYPENNFFPLGSSLDLGRTSNKWKDLYLSGKITDGTKSYSVNDLSVKFTEIDNKLVDKQNTNDEALSTTNKTIVGAINELNTKITSANTQLETILGE